MMKFVCLLVALCVAANATVYFSDNFDSGASNWVKSTQKSDFGDMKVSSGKFKADNGLQTSQDARFYGYSAPFSKEFNNEGKPLVFQFSVTHEQNIDCGGGYLKVLPKTEGTSFHGESPYYIMFGPDICGMTKRIHLIFGYKGKNLLWKKEPRCESDELTHFYTVIVNPDNTYEVRVDNVKKESGKLEEDWDFLPAKEIDDPNDKKPSDWVDDSEIVDPEDKKPSDWDDEPETVVDPEAAKPEDWDEEEDGAWEAPSIPNPKFKGEWRAKMIPNPAYKGIWKPKQIANPEYAPDANLYRYTDSNAVGVDLWQVKSGTIFDNVLVTDDVKEAEAAFNAYKPKMDAEKKTKEEKEEKERKEAEEKAKAEKSDEKDEEDGDDEDGHDEL